MGHARALLALATREEIQVVASKIARDRLSVRQVEELVKSLTTAANPAAPAPTPKGRPVWVHEIEETLSEAIGVPVRVHYGRKRSRITLECGGREQFERTYEKLKGLAQEE